MIQILKMNASFGNLQKQELTLHDGLNVFCLSNEAGKSTWSAFLLCMLYGVDTAERASKTNIPAKVRYQPWWGGNMEGRIELLWNGRRITIERASTARTPMGQFRAWDLDSGEKLPELTADNCGQTLLGVSRSVFVRSAFLGQNALGVTQDAALEKRLAALVTSGEEAVSAAETQKRLKNARNRIRHNQTGLLPQAERDLRETEQMLAQRKDLLEEDLQSRAQAEQLTKQANALRQELEDAEQFRAAKQFEKKREAEVLLREKTRQAETALAQAQKGPEPKTLQSLRQDLKTLQARRAALAQDMTQQAPSAPQAPVCPQVFADCSADEILKKAAQDAKRCQALTAGKKAPAAGWLALGGCAFFAAILLWVLGKNIPFAAVSAAAALGFFTAGMVCTGKNRAREERLHAAAILRAQYEGRSPEQFVAFAADYHAQVLLSAQAQANYEQACRSYEAARQAEQEKRNDLSELRGKILGAIRVFDDAVTDEASAEAALSRAERAWQDAEEAQQQVQYAKAALDALTQALAGREEPQVPAGDWTQFDEKTAKRELAQIERSLSAVQSKLDQNRGRMQTLGDGAALEAKKAVLEAQIGTLGEREEALAMAEQALEDASGTLQTQFAPKLTARAGKIFSKLTNARYDKIMLDRQMHLAAGERGDVVFRQALALSGGTLDQLYLALRLAIVELALPEGTPMVLDDALAMFDDERAARALEVLQELAKTRQILLFSCHSRENTILAAQMP